MATPYIIVDWIRRVELPTSLLAQMRGVPADRAVIELQGASCLLDMSKPKAAIWAALLDELRTEQTPVYLTVDPATNLIQEILLPRALYVAKVAALPVGGQLDVELEVSCARHFLRTSNPQYSQLLNSLLGAYSLQTPVLVTETPDEHEIIDVRAVPLPFVRGAAMMASPPPPPNVPAAGLPPLPTGAPTVVTAPEAVHLFNLVAGLREIPFTYPDDGCWVRAHKMCQVILANGFLPRKLWIYGALAVSTRNHPQCKVSWTWHVAPTLQVNTATGSQMEVIDPGLFTAPVSQVTWTAAQNDPNAQSYDTDASVFQRSATGQVTNDLNYIRTRILLRYFNAELAARILRRGPPPYAHCP